MTEDAAADLVRALVEHMKGAEDAWESLSMVVVVDGGRFRTTYGYSYGPGESISAVASRPTGVKEPVLAYLASHYGPDEAPPVKLLVQLDRSTGNYEITFEDVDTERWKVSPANLDQIRQELRPHLAR